MSELLTALPTAIPHAMRPKMVCRIFASTSWLKLSDIEVDPEVGDALWNTTYLGSDSQEDYSSSYKTGTASLTETIQEYVYENGRRYHVYFGEGRNPCPTDELEQDRLDLHHEIFLILLDRALHNAPIGDSPHRILDLGTGTGIWAIDMADKYQSAEVIGVDLSPIQPKWVPPNCRFELDDAELEWAYKPEFFDFIHCRNICQAVTDWPKLLPRAYGCTKPGGYIELAEVGLVAHCDDGSVGGHDGVMQFSNLLRDALARIGRPDVNADTLKGNLAEAGFVDIHATTYKQPFAPWPKDKKLKQVGAIALVAADTGFHAYGMALYTNILRMTPEEADSICRNAQLSVKNRKNHGYSYFYVIYGRKPE